MEKKNVKKGNQLHQLLAVENEKKNTAAGIMKETIKTFKDKQGHFDGEIRKYTKTTEDSDELPSETKEVVSTVKEKLDYTNKFIVDAMDTQLMKEETNASGVAMAELNIGDINLGTFSATGLLQIEGQLKSIRAIYINIPTLDPVKRWSYNNQTGIYESEKETTYRNTKEPKVILLHAPTKEHPAQTSLINVDKQVGTWEKTFQSGRVTPLQKSQMLGKIDQLINAVKKARSIANGAEVKHVKVAKRIFEFINQPIK